MTVSRPLILHFATGGFAHFLRLLENSVQWASRWGFHVVVISEPAKTLAFLSFHDLFAAIRPLPIIPLRDVPEELLVRPNGANVTEYLDYWGGGPCVLRSGEAEEFPRSVTFMNRFAKRPQLTIGDQKRFFPRTYHHLLPRLSLAQSIADPVNRAVAEFSGRGTVGVHFRNTDSPGNLEETLARLDRILIESKASRVLWCSDDARSIEQARAEFPHLEIVEGSAKPPIQQGAGSLHGGVEDTNVEWMLSSALVDIALLSRTEHFLPAPNSAWAQLVPYFRAHPEVRRSFFRLQE